jgi:glycosyltransferase involved in cell wall biosynthesis
MGMKEENHKTRVLFLVKGDQQAKLSSQVNLDGLPKERYWGLGLLQERKEFLFTPLFLGGQPLPITYKVINRFIPPPKTFGYMASRPLLRNLKMLQGNFDVALSVHNGATATLLWLKKGKRSHPRIICLLIGVADWLEKTEPNIRSKTLEYLAGADCLLSLGKTEVEFLQTMGLQQTVFLPFGVDTEYWSPTSELIEDYVFAVGSDPCRDFDSLIKACPYPLKIMTRNRHLITVSVPSNVSFVQGDTDELRRLYARSRVVVVPLKDRMQPSGQNTILQAMAMGKPVILTQTRGTWSDNLRNMENCLYVQPEDPHDLQEGLRLLYENRPLAQSIGLKARETARAYFDAYHLGNALSDIILRIASQ